MIKISWQIENKSVPTAALRYAFIQKTIVSKVTNFIINDVLLVLNRSAQSRLQFGGGKAQGVYRWMFVLFKIMCI